jgi:hypothetical protein
MCGSLEGFEEKNNLARSFQQNFITFSLIDRLMPVVGKLLLKSSGDTLLQLLVKVTRYF